MEAAGLKRVFFDGHGGSVSLSVMGGYAYLHDFEASGFGHIAIFRARAAARRLGFSEVRMWIDPENLPMVALMEGLGCEAEAVLYIGGI